jgi:hypothetical protein
VHLNYGALLEIRGQLADAVRVYRQALRLDPRSERAHMCLRAVVRRVRPLPASRRCSDRPATRWARSARRTRRRRRRRMCRTTRSPSGRWSAQWSPSRSVRPLPAHTDGRPLCA